MIIDGGKISEEIKKELAAKISGFGAKLALDIVQVGKDAVSGKFIKRKEAFARDIGVEARVRALPENITSEELVAEIKKLCASPEGGEEKGGVIVQLPLPSHIAARSVLDAIPLQKDVDVLSAAATGRFAVGGGVLPPVVGAVKEIFDRVGFEVKGKNAAVVGAGILVGKPAAVWLVNRGASVFVLRSRTGSVAKYTGDADVIVSGAGKPGLITPEMVKEGAVVIDAGTSLEGGGLAGDVRPEVAEKASVFTPVPGGIGPLTVAMVFKNLVELNERRPR